MWMLRTVIYAVSVLAGTACASQATNPVKPHHTENGFINPQEQENTGLVDFLKWRRDRLFMNIPGRGAYDFPLAEPDTGFLRHNRAINTATWIGHATLPVQMDGLNILTDPQFSR